MSLSGRASYWQIELVESNSLAAVFGHLLA
jgi:hypothetical protein